MLWDVHTQHGNNAVGFVYAANGKEAFRKALARWGLVNPYHVVYVERQHDRKIYAPTEADFTTKENR